METIKNIRINKTIRNTVVSSAIKETVSMYLQKKWHNEMTPGDTIDRLSGLTYDLSQFDGADLYYRPNRNPDDYLCQPDYDRTIIYAENKLGDIKIVVSNAETIGEMNEYLCELNNYGYNKNIRFYSILFISSSKSPYIDESYAVEDLENICSGKSNWPLNLKDSNFICRC